MITAKLPLRRRARLILRKSWLLIEGRFLTWLYERGYIIKVKR